MRYIYSYTALCAHTHTSKWCIRTIVWMSKMKGQHRISVLTVTAIDMRSNTQWTCSTWQKVIFSWKKDEPMERKLWSVEMPSIVCFFSEGEGREVRGLTDYQCSMCRKSISNLFGCEYVWMCTAWLGSVRLDSHRKHGIIKFLSSPFFHTHSLIHSLILPFPPSSSLSPLSPLSSSAVRSWHSLRVWWGGGGGWQ